MSLVSKLLKTVRDRRNPWRPYNSWTNHLLNTSPESVARLREHYKLTQQSCSQYIFHFNPPQGVTVDLIKDGILTLRYDPDVEHAKYPGFASISTDGKPMHGFVHPYEPTAEGRADLPVRPFIGEKYDFGQTPKSGAQINPSSIEHNIFNAVKNFSDAKEKTIPVPVELVDKVIQLANEREYDGILKELRR